MFKDANEELNRLQEQLLAEETKKLPKLDEDLLSDQMLDALLDTDYRSYNTDHTDLDTEELSEAVSQPAEPSLRGLIIANSILLFCILLVVIWWLIRYGGSF